MSVTTPTSGGYQENQRLALVCADAPERQPVVVAALEQLGLVPHVAKSAEEAIERIRREPFEVVVVDEQFQGATALDSPLLAALAAMPMSSRRYVFVALLGREYKTFDNMMAFTRSVNVVINLNDLPHLPAILRRGLADNDAFFEVLREVLREAGRR